MSTLTIVATIKAHADKIELVKNELEKLIAPTRTEAGCMQYDLHQDNENPAHFLFYENWESRALWLDHMETSHLQIFKAATAGALESIAVEEMTRIG